MYYELDSTNLCFLLLQIQYTERYDLKTEVAALYVICNLSFVTFPTCG